jgi:hypothetical protein
MLPLVDRNWQLIPPFSFIGNFAGSKITWVSLGAHQEGLHSGLDIGTIFVKQKTSLVLIKRNVQTFLTMNHA